MLKKTAQRAAPARSLKQATSERFRVVGELSDGVKILAPKSKPKHFTSKQIKSTIQKVLLKSKTTRSSKAATSRG